MESDERKPNSAFLFEKEFFSRQNLLNDTLRNKERRGLPMKGVEALECEFVPEKGFWVLKTGNRRLLGHGAVLGNRGGLLELCTPFGVFGLKGVPTGQTSYGMSADGETAETVEFDEDEFKKALEIKASIGKGHVLLGNETRFSQRAPEKVLWLMVGKRPAWWALSKGFLSLGFGDGTEEAIDVSGPCRPLFILREGHGVEIDVPELAESQKP